jgi:hypothetical protein
MRRSDREESFGRSCFVVRLVSWLRVCVRKIGEIYLRLPAALQRRSVWRDPKVQHAWQTYVGESVGGHLDGIDVSLGDELSSRFSTERVSSPKSSHVRNSAKREGALAELAERKEQTTRTQMGKERQGCGPSLSSFSPRTFARIIAVWSHRQHCATD